MLGSDAHSMARRELRHNRHTVSLLTDHMVITPKYRGKILVEKTIALVVEGIIRKTCKEMKIEIIDKALECGSCSSVYRISPEVLLSGFIAKKIKGRSSRILRQHFPHLKEWCKDHLWAPGCYHGSVGHGWAVVEVYRDARLCAKGRIAMHKPCS